MLHCERRQVLPFVWFADNCMCPTVGLQQLQRPTINATSPKTNVLPCIFGLLLSFLILHHQFSPTSLLGHLQPMGGDQVNRVSC